MTNRNYLAEGSSNSVTGLYPTIYTAATTVPTTLTDVAVAGNAISDFEGRVTSNNALLIAGAVNFMTMWPFNNDFGGSGDPNNAANLAILNRYYTLWSNYRSSGWRVIVISSNPFGDIWAGNAANYNTVVSDYHSRITSNVGIYVDGIIDWWNDINYGYIQRNDTSKYADGVHISNPAGQTYLANLFLPILDQIQATKRGRSNLRSL